MKTIKILNLALFLTLIILHTFCLCKSSTSKEGEEILQLTSRSRKSNHRNNVRQARREFQYEAPPPSEDQGEGQEQGQNQKPRPKDDNKYMRGESENFQPPAPIPSEIQSSPNCPEPDEVGRAYINFGDSGKCYIAGEKGPCPENMILFPQKGSENGYCDCNCNSYFPGLYHSPRSFCRGRTNRGEIRSLAFVTKLGSCQPLFEQGYCPRGYWLAFDDDPKKDPICERAVCDTNRFDFIFFDTDSGKCRRLGQRCQLPSPTYSRTQNRDYGTYKIVDSSWIPICTLGDDDDLRDENRSTGGSIRNLDCEPGFRWSPRRGTCLRSNNGGGGIG